MSAPADATGDKDSRVLHLDLRVLRRRGLLSSEGEGKVIAWLCGVWIAASVALSLLPLPWDVEAK